MTADFNEVYWMLEHDLRAKFLNEHEFYVLRYKDKFICIRKLGAEESKPRFNDKYLCFINKHNKVSDVIICNSVNFDAKDWISGSGITPKEAILDTIRKALDNPTVADKEMIKNYKSTLGALHNIFASIRKLMML